MDYASVQVMVVSLNAREAVENSIRNLIVTKSVILHLSLYRNHLFGGNYYSFIQLSTMKRDLVLGLTPARWTATRSDSDSHSNI